VPEEVKHERYERIMALSARISTEKLRAKVGRTIDVLIDRVDEVPLQDLSPSPLRGSGPVGPSGGRSAAGRWVGERGPDSASPGATGRSKADAPEIDGEVHLRNAGGLHPGDIVSVHVEDSDEHDLYGVPV